MYWIRVTLLILIVFVPSYIRDGFYIFDMTQMQEFVILLIGSVSLFIYTITDKRLKRSINEKNKFQGQVNDMSKDLKYSYSYIGETNRKLDILENIALGYPEKSNLKQKDENELYNSIMDAIRIFGKSDEFEIHFISLSNYKVLREIKNYPENNLGFLFKKHDWETNHFESGNFIVTTSPKAIDGIFSCIVIKKKTLSHTIEDVEIMKTLATQALFLFVFTRNKKKIKCVI